MKTTTKQWQKVAAAFCMVLMVMALAVVPVQADVAMTYAGRPRIDASTLDFTVAPGAIIRLRVEIQHNLSGSFANNDLWIGYFGVLDKSAALAKKNITDSSGSITVEIDVPVPTQPGTYDLVAFAMADTGGGAMIPWSSSNAATVIVTAQASQGMSFEQSTAFWQGVHYEMFYTTAKTVKANANLQGLNYVPHYILDYLYDNPSMTLRLQYSAKTYVLNAKTMEARCVVHGLNYLFTSLDAMGL